MQNSARAAAVALLVSQRGGNRWLPQTLAHEQSEVLDPWNSFLMQGPGHTLEFSNEARAASIPSFRIGPRPVGIEGGLPFPK